MIGEATLDDTPVNLALNAWEFSSPLYAELERRFSCQFAQDLLNEDVMPRLRTLYRTIGRRNLPMSLTDYIQDLADPLSLNVTDAEFLAQHDPPEEQANLLEFFRTTIELINRYGLEFIAKNADLPTTAPPHNRDWYFHARSLDQVAIQLERHLDATLDADGVVTESSVT